MLRSAERFAMHWFVANAPIRKKLLVSFGSMVGLVGLSPLTLLLVPKLALVMRRDRHADRCGAGRLYRHAIATPYVTTVVRMEALAAGDLASPIQFTDYRDCVGRLTRAMFSFRDTAAAQIRQNEEAEHHGEIVRGMTVNLERLGRRRPDRRHRRGISRHLCEAARQFQRGARFAAHLARRSEREQCGDPYRVGRDRPGVGGSRAPYRGECRQPRADFSCNRADGRAPQGNRRRGEPHRGARRWGHGNGVGRPRGGRPRPSRR